MASGAEVTIVVREGYKDMVNNLALARRFGTHLESLGRDVVEQLARLRIGGVDDRDDFQQLVKRNRDRRRLHRKVDASRRRSELSSCRQ